MVAPCFFQIVDGGADELDDFGVVGCVAEEGFENPDLCALQSARLEGGGEVELGGVAGGGIVRVFAGGGVENGGEVGHRAGERAAGILRDGEGDDATDAGEALGGAEAGEVIDGGGDADGATGVRAHAGGGETGGDGGPGTAAGAAGVARGVVGVAGLAEGGTDGGDAGGEFVEVGLGDEDGTGVAEFLHLEGVGIGGEPEEGERAGGSGHVAGGVVVLDDDGDAVEGAAGTAGFAFAIESFGFGEGGGV